MITKLLATKSTKYVQVGRSEEPEYTRKKEITQKKNEIVRQQQLIVCPYFLKNLKSGEMEG